MEEKEEYKFNCDKCNYRTKHESHWKIHIETELHKTGRRKKRSDIKEEYKCEQCEFKSKNVYNMKQHKLNEHSEKQERKKEFKYYCEYCDIGTFSEEIYEKHIKTQKHQNIINILKLNNLLK